MVIATCVWKAKVSGSMVSKVSMCRDELFTVIDW